MSTRINTNIEAMNAQRQLGITAGAFAKSVERLSSGLRINRAADDAAGLAISEKLRGQIRGLNQAGRNVQDAVSMLQTAEGALNAVESIVQRMRELSVQAANGAISDTDRANINSELVALRAETDRIATSTTFNNQAILSGSLSTVQGAGAAGGTLMTGTAITANSSATRVDVGAAVAGTTYTLAAGTIVGTVKMTATINGNVVVQDNVAPAASAAGVSQVVSFATFGINVTVSSVNAVDTAANISTGLAGKTIITAAGSSAAVFQLGANATDTLNVNFASVSIAGLGLSAALTAFNGATTVGNATALLTAIDAAGQGLQLVSTTRAGYGAVQNRLEYASQNIDIAAENLTASESRIRDLDVADEMVNFTKTQILQQAGTAILAQANSAPSSILALLK
jgi:flagellin